jgi:hypothetical protein
LSLALETEWTVRGRLVLMLRTDVVASHDAGLLGAGSGRVRNRVLGGGRLAQLGRIGTRCWWQVGQLAGDRTWGLVSASSAVPSSATP